MASPSGERAIEDATRYGNAILKFISPNDAGLTGSHQCGFYLPKAAWELYADFGPVKDTFNEEEVQITWPDGRITDSRVKWYGTRTRSEYRLTRFGRDFPWLGEDTVGSLFVLIPVTHKEFLAYVLDNEEDIEDVQAALGVQIIDTWGVYEHGAPQVETADECLNRKFREFAAPLVDFPSGEIFSATTRAFLEECIRRFNEQSADIRLLTMVDTEYQLFRRVERQIVQSDIVRNFRDVDDFLQTAARIMNRRKSRAGRSLENHVGHILNTAGISHSVRPNVDGKPDILIPGEREYLDRNFPIDKLVVIGVKTTCKDRWRQVLNEARRIPHKHILTTQRGITTNQLREMNEANVTLVVPSALHREYPAERPSMILSVEEFIQSVRGLVGNG
jgi:hypothetical protein